MHMLTKIGPFSLKSWLAKNFPCAKENRNCKTQDQIPVAVPKETDWNNPFALRLSRIGSLFQRGRWEEEQISTREKSIKEN